MELIPNLGMIAYVRGLHPVVRINLGIWLGLFLALRQLKTYLHLYADTPFRADNSDLLIFSSSGVTIRRSDNDGGSQEQVELSESELGASIDALCALAKSRDPGDRAKWLELDFAASFVVTHEISHYLTNDSRRGIAELLSGRRWDHEREHAADMLGTKLLLQYVISSLETDEVVKDCIRIIAVARGIAFSILLFAARTKLIPAHRVDTHPSPRARLMVIVNTLFCGGPPFQPQSEFLRTGFTFSMLDAVRQWEDAGWPGLAEDEPLLDFIKSAETLYKNLESLAFDQRLYASGRAGMTADVDSSIWIPANDSDHKLATFLNTTKTEVRIGVVAKSGTVGFVYANADGLFSVVWVPSSSLSASDVVGVISQSLERSLSYLLFISPGLFDLIGAESIFERYRSRRRMVSYLGGGASRLDWGDRLFWSNS